MIQRLKKIRVPSKLLRNEKDITWKKRRRNMVIQGKENINSFSIVDCKDRYKNQGIDERILYVLKTTIVIKVLNRPGN